MNKKIYSVALAALPLMASAQTEGTTAKAWQDNLVARMEFGAGYKNKNVSPMAWNVQLGYRLLPQLGVFADYEAATMLYNGNGVKTYGRTTNLGGGLGFSFCDYFELRAKMAASVGSVDVKQTVYDVNLRVKWAKWRVSPYVSLGFRHVSSHTTGWNNYNGFYGSLGFGL